MKFVLPALFIALLVACSPTSETWPITETSIDILSNTKDISQFKGQRLVITGIVYGIKANETGTVLTLKSDTHDSYASAFAHIPDYEREFINSLETRKSVRIICTLADIEKPSIPALEHCKPYPQN